MYFLRISILNILLFGKQKLEKLQEEEQVDKPFIRKQMKIRFPERGRSGREVVAIKNLDFAYEDKVTGIFINIELDTTSFHFSCLSHDVIIKGCSV